MSLYNAIYGYSSAVYLVLPMLGKHPDEYPRFRNCFIGGDEERPQYDNHIQVFTRVGGGNRESYSSEIEEMRKDPHYITDYDDSFDNTYATFVFKVPEKFKADYEKLTDKKYNELSEEYRKELYHIYPKLIDELEKWFKNPGGNND